MKLERVGVTRLRSAKSSALADCGQLNVLVGKNNCGKSTLLSAIRAFFTCIDEGQIVALDPPFGDVIDFYRRETDQPIEIELLFSLKLAERDELVRNIAVEAPQLRNVVDGLDPNLWLSVTLSITLVPARFAYISKLALVNPRLADGSRVLFAVNLQSAAELYAKSRNLRRAESESDRMNEATKNLDEDDFRRIREGGSSIPRSFAFRRMSEVSPSMQQTFESLLRDSTTAKEFRRSVAVSGHKLVEEAKSAYAEPLKSSIETFSGEDAEVPKYVHAVLQSIAQIRVLYLNELRKPLGKEEAQRLLDLKVRRGGNEALKSIQETVYALLGVRIDAFESNAPGPSKPAEMDVDDFLLEVNGSGVREALRLILDYEFKQPDILLVEEPEVHLHPALEIAMMRYLKRISVTSQVFLSTHSTNFIDAGDMTNVYLVSKDQHTSVQQLNAEDAQSKIPKELGLRLSALFMFDRLVFVEGPSDEAVIREFANTLGINLAERNVGFISMGGVRNFTHYATEAILSFLSKRQVTMTFLLDRDENDEADVKRITEQLGARARVHVLRKRELENYLTIPRAMSVFLESKLRTAQKTNTINSTEVLNGFLVECAEELKGFALLKRLSKSLCRPVLTDGALPTKVAENEVKAVVSMKIDQQLKQLSERRESLDAIFAREAGTLEEQWALSKLDLIPGTELLDGVFQRYGVRFRKETDSSRLAAEMNREEIDMEFRTLINAFSE